MRPFFSLSFLVSFFSHRVDEHWSKKTSDENAYFSENNAIERRGKEKEKTIVVRWSRREMIIGQCSSSSDLKKQIEIERL